jgi:drug/metabolite transporter (DMT)-like permease
MEFLDYLDITFFVWDYGVKKGNIKLLGTLSYAAPLISTILLISFGLAPLTISVIVACIFIVGGAFIAALDSFIK